MFRVVVVIFWPGVKAPVVVNVCTLVTALVALIPPAVVVSAAVAVGNWVWVIRFVVVSDCAVVGAVVLVKGWVAVVTSVLVTGPVAVLVRLLVVVNACSVVRVAVWVKPWAVAVEIIVLVAIAVVVIGCVVVALPVATTGVAITVGAVVGATVGAIVGGTGVAVGSSPPQAAQRKAMRIRMTSGSPTFANPLANPLANTLDRCRMLPTPVALVYCWRTLVMMQDCGFVVNSVNLFWGFSLLIAPQSAHCPTRRKANRPVHPLFAWHEPHQSDDRQSCPVAALPNPDQFATNAPSRRLCNKSPRPDGGGVDTRY